MKKLKTKDIIIIISGLLLLIFMFGKNPFTETDTFESDKKFKSPSGKEYRGAQRFCLTDTPQKFEFPMGRRFSFWTDNGTPYLFEFRYAPNGEPIDSDKIKFIPSTKVYVSKKPGSVSRCITLAYTSK